MPVATTQAAPAALAAPQLQRRRGPNLAILPWVAPAALIILAVFGYSLFQLFSQSLQYQGTWAGIENFKLVLTDPLFLTAIWHNALLLLVVPVLLALSLGVAIVLLETKRGLRGYRAALFFPYILPIPVVGVVFGQLLQLNGGLNEALRSVGLGGLASDWLGDPSRALWTMAAIIVWKEVGFGIILFLARMLSLPADVFEAARLDGAGFFRMHWHVTIPQLRGVVLFYVVNEAIVMVSWVFNYVYVMTNGQGGPGSSTVVSELYIYRAAFADQTPELAASAAVLLFIATLGLIVGFFRLQRSGEGAFGD
ncbi:carbohydrate ABC transporter permease [Streptomyces sp. NPDC092129]|uniref:carbohydrate ABC transporter permease n=1 Tax=Streptomyces sp. NPDC092129 TaxID=3366010 RepID=UPI003819C85F